jgi:R3H domain/G-patch domain
MSYSPWPVSHPPHLHNRSTANLDPGRGKDKRNAFPPELQAQWDKDRAKKAARKAQREAERLERAADPFSNKKGGKKGRKAMLAAAAQDPIAVMSSANRIFDITTLVQMIRRFVDDLGGKSSMSLPPTSKETRKNVHELAIAFGLNSASKGKGENRYVTLSKTTRTGRIDEKKVSKVVRRAGGAGGFGNDFGSGTGGRGRGGGKVVVPKHREGEEVGGKAPKIDATNVGFRMLAMMGWAEGQRIGGVGGGEGLADPLVAIVKNSKLGLGARM